MYGFLIKHFVNTLCIDCDHCQTVKTKRAAGTFGQSIALEYIVESCRFAVFGSAAGFAELA